MNVNWIPFSVLDLVFGVLVFSIFGILVPQFIHSPHCVDDDYCAAIHDLSPVLTALFSIERGGFNKHVPLFLIKLLCYWCTIKRNVCPLGCICFDPVYCCQWGETRWNYALILFNVYMDDLSIALNSSSIGRERVLS